MNILRVCCAILLVSCSVESTAPTHCACSERTWSCTGKETLTQEDMCDRNISIVEFRKNRFTSIPVNLPESVITLIMEENQLTRLPMPPQIPSTLEGLSVSRNRISDTSNELQKLTELSVLNIAKNNISSMGFLPAPCNLEVLYAGRNAIRDIDPVLKCTRLIFLTLQNNELSSLSSGLFENMTRLNTILLSKNKLTSLPSRAFSGSSNLQTLRLESNEIANVETETFSGLSRLRILNLENNRLSHLPENVFAELDELEDLFLNGNKLSILESEPRSHFAGLKNLQVLDIGNNYLKELPDTAFVGLSRLNVLILSRNPLVTMPSRVLEPLNNLISLYIEDIMMTSVPEKGPWTTTFERLYMDGNKLEKLSDGMFDGAGSLRIISCRNNTLSTISRKALSGLSSLGELHLQDNLIEELDMIVFEDLSSLRHFHLENNKLTALPEFKSAMTPKLENAFFCDNNITEVDEATLRSWLIETKRERLLDLGGNKIRTPATLQWVLEDTEVKKGANVNDPSCGFLTRGKARVNLCVDMPGGEDPSAPADWIEAVRTGWSRYR